MPWRCQPFVLRVAPDTSSGNGTSKPIKHLDPEWRITNRYLNTSVTCFAAKARQTLFEA
jgi:hypothetical protein